MKRILFIVTISIFTQLVMAQNKRALLVGISDYQCVNKYGGWNNIHGKNDIDMLYPTLKKVVYQHHACMTKVLLRQGLLKP